MRVRPVQIPNNYKLLNCRTQKFVQIKPGIYEVQSEEPVEMSLKNYRDVSMQSVEYYAEQVINTFGIPKEELSTDNITDFFWDSLKESSQNCLANPIYAVDNEKSRYPKDWAYWNLNEMDAATSGLSSKTIKMPGINSPFLYYAMPHAAFAIHHEDSNCASINTHHGGGPRIWYSIPSSNSENLEKVPLTYFS